MMITAQIYPGAIGAGGAGAGGITISGGGAGAGGIWIIGGGTSLTTTGGGAATGAVATVKLAMADQSPITGVTALTLQK